MTLVKHLSIEKLFDIQLYVSWKMEGDKYANCTFRSYAQLEILNAYSELLTLKSCCKLIHCCSYDLQTENDYNRKNVLYWRDKHLSSCGIYKYIMRSITNDTGMEFFALLNFMQAQLFCSLQGLYRRYFILLLML